MKYVNVVGVDEFSSLVVACEIHSRMLVNPRVFAFFIGIRALFYCQGKISFHFRVNALLENYKTLKYSIKESVLVASKTKGSNAETFIGLEFALFSGGSYSEAVAIIMLLHFGCSARFSSMHMYSASAAVSKTKRLVFIRNHPEYN
jgi:hypothetical protein